jgi:hypothetical protein
MRSSCRVSTLAAVAALAGIGATPAYAFQPGPLGGGPETSGALVSHHPSSSIDWPLIGTAGAGAIALVGASVGARRRRLGVAAARTRGAGPASGS